MLQTGLLDVAARGYEETWSDEDGFEFDPDWERYEREEKNESLRVMAVRDGEKLVGYATLRLHTALVDKKKLICVIQDIFLEKHYRKGLCAGLIFMKKIHEIISYLSVHKIIIAERASTKSGALFEYMGYKCKEHIWAYTVGA